MKKILTILIVSVCSFHLYAQSTIRGRVLDAETNTPLSQLLVEIQDTNFETYTNKQGVFTFFGVEASKIIIAFYKDNLKPILYEVVVDSSTIELGDLALNFDQSNDELIDKSLMVDDNFSDDFDNSTNFISGLFQASKDEYLKAAAFNFNQAWYKVRGYDANLGSIQINGISMNKLSNGRPQWSNWSGLNDVFINQDFTNGISPSSYGFGGVLGLVHFSTKASEYQKAGKVSLSSTNKSYTGRLMATYASGITKNNWAYVISGSRRYANEGYFDGSLFDSWATFLAVEKLLSSKHSLNFTAILSSNKRGRTSPSTQEVTNLKGYKYNSYWGYQNGKKRNARIRSIFEPIFMLTHSFDDGKLSVESTLSFQFGHNSTSRLGFYNAPNPDPTYWQYLPSYFLSDEQFPNYEKAYLATENFIENGQINWQELYEINSTNETAKYYVFEDRNEDKTLSFNSILTTPIFKNGTLTSTLSYQNVKSRNFALMSDLLGSTHFIDLNQFELDDAQQNNLLNPNNDIFVGDVFQYNYTINASLLQQFTQFQFQTNKIDYSVAFQVNRTNYQREGKFKNGVFYDSSFGESEKLTFFNISTKASFLYKINGRNLIQLNAAYLQKPPAIQESFINARVTNIVAPDITNEQISSIDASYYYRGIKLTGRITGFLTQFSNSSESAYYFAEGIQGDQADFVSELITGIQKKHLGLEYSLKYDLLSNLSIISAGSIGEYTYQNNPNLYLQSQSKSNLNFEFGNTYIKNYRISGSPQQAYSLGIEYRDPTYWWFQINGNYLTHNFIDISPILRTENFYKDSDGLPFIDVATGENITNDQVSSLLKQEKIDPVFYANFVAGKSWLLNNKFLGVFLGVNNIFGNTFKIAGFEQARKANYEELLEDQSLKYPLFGSKYWYNTNTTYYINLYLKF